MRKESRRAGGAPNAHVLRNEPLRRNDGGKPHWAELAYRTGGETVWVSERFPAGLGKDAYAEYLRAHPFRFATTDDIASLVRLRAAFLAEVADANPSAPAPLAALERYFATALPAGEFIAILAEADAQIVATSGLVFHRHAPSARNLSGVEGYILNMYTLLVWRRRGLEEGGVAAPRRSPVWGAMREPGPKVVSYSPNGHLPTSSWLGRKLARELRFSNAILVYVRPLL